MSIARKHFEKTLAAKQAAGKPGATAATATDISTKMQALLAMHKSVLKAIQSKKEKANVKAEFLPEYAGYVEGILEAETGDQDDVIMTVMIWRLDAGDYAGALEIAGYAIDHGLAMPVHFNRDVATTVLEEIADRATDDPGADLVGPLGDAITLTHDCDMPDEVRAKAHKALGNLLLDSDPAKALEHLKIALEFNPKCGVKTLIGKVEKQIEEAAQAGEPAKDQ